jgi:hypothetical protein
MSVIVKNFSGLGGLVCFEHYLSTESKEPDKDGNGGKE